MRPPQSPDSLGVLYLVVIFVFPSWQEKLLTRRTMSAAITRAASISIPRLYGLVCITNAVVPTLTVLMRESNMTPFRALPPVEFGPQAQSDHLNIIFNRVPDAMDQTLYPCLIAAVGSKVSAARKKYKVETAVLWFMHVILANQPLFPSNFRAATPLRSFC